MYYIKYLDIFRAIVCSSSGGQNCILQHLVSSLSVSGRAVRGLRADFVVRSDSESRVESGLLCKVWFRVQSGRHFGKMYNNGVCLWLKVRVPRPLEKVRETLWQRGGQWFPKQFLLAFRGNSETSLQDPTNNGGRRPSHQHENCKREKILQMQQGEFGMLEELCRGLAGRQYYKINSLCRHLHSGTWSWQTNSL
jgi:hypothetical protein